MKRTPLTNSLTTYRRTIAEKLVVFRLAKGFLYPEWDLKFDHRVHKSSELDLVMNLSPLHHIYKYTMMYQSNTTELYYLAQYLTNLMHKICFTISFISCLYMFRAHVLIIRRSKLHFTASGIITPIGVMIPEAV